MSAPQAFDSLAPTYDYTFTDTQIGRYLRARVHTRLDAFGAGNHVLELGCGRVRMR
jgi:ubiquinone/menaquinone biosynthesis C-methylase UbiE